MIAEIARHYPDLDDVRRGAELVRELISYLIGAVVTEARRRLEAAQPQSVDDVRNHGQAADRVSARGGAGGGRDQGVPEAAGCTAIPRVMRVMGEAEADPVRPVRALPAQPGRPAGRMASRDGDERESEAERARRIGNFIAGMTDRFALTEHQRLFDSTPDLR